MKTFIFSLINAIANTIILISYKTKLGRAFISTFLENSFSLEKDVNHNGCTLKFTTPNILNYVRAMTFSNKEPETLEWIDNIPRGSIIWDVGANVGLYSCYAAKQRECTVISFEPSVFNLELLARNIYINNLTDKVTIIPLPLCDSILNSTLNMTTTDWGGALSTFGEEFGCDGKHFDAKFKFSTIGITLDSAHTLLNLPKPNYIKMDVDGIEHMILTGGAEVLKDVQSIIIEVNDDFEEMAEGVKKCLSSAGFTLSSAEHADFFDDIEHFKNTFNQIWTKPLSSLG